MAWPRRPLILSPAQQQAFAADWTAGATYDELTARYQLSTGGVVNYRRRLGLPARRCGRPSRDPVIRKAEPKFCDAVDFPFRYIPPREARPTRWRCECGGVSEIGPRCERCEQREAAA